MKEDELRPGRHPVPLSDYYEASDADDDDSEEETKQVLDRTGDPVQTRDTMHILLLLHNQTARNMNEESIYSIRAFLSQLLWSLTAARDKVVINSQACIDIIHFTGICMMYTRNDPRSAEIPIIINGRLDIADPSTKALADKCLHWRTLWHKAMTVWQMAALSLAVEFADHLIQIPHIKQMPTQYDIRAMTEALDHFDNFTANTVRAILDPASIEHTICGHRLHPAQQHFHPLDPDLHPAGGDYRVFEEELPGLAYGVRFRLQPQTLAKARSWAESKIDATLTMSDMNHVNDELPNIT